MSNNYKNYVLDARPDRLDLRDREYRPHLRSLPPQFPSDYFIEQLLPHYENAGLILNQGREGACTGFGLAATINYLIWREHIEAVLQNDAEAINDAAAINETSLAVKEKLVSERMLYHMARIYDEWPGEDYSGSSCRGAMKGWHRHGVCTRIKWPYDSKTGKFLPPEPGWEVEALQNTLGAYYRIDKHSVVDMQAAIYEVGAIYCSAKVHKGWYLPSTNSLPVISIPSDEKIIGGHAFCIIGYNTEGFIVQNSWGERWGYEGFAILRYEDWVQNGSDAWIVARGVPIALDRAPTMLGTDSLNDSQLDYAAIRASSKRYHRRKMKTSSYKYSAGSKTKPWSRDKALEHAVIIENNGRPKHTYIAAENCEASATYICETQLRKWLDTNRTNRKVVIFAHGGLVSQDDAIDKIKIMGPGFYANDIYPIFIAWNTDLLTTIRNMISEFKDQLFDSKELRDEASLIEKITEKTDRLIESLARGIKAKGIWSEMKENAEMASDRSILDAGSKGAMVCLAEALEKLKTEFSNLEIHIIGHSAGSILLGAWLNELKKRKLALHSASLYAPACTIQFANDTYKKSIENGILKIKDLYIHNMNDEREKADTTSPLYRKSLLYFVSRALEDIHKMPLLGIDASWDTENYYTNKTGGFNNSQRREAAKWKQFIDKGNKPILYKKKHRVLIARKPNSYEKLAHGSFDNDINVIEHSIKIIRRSELKVELKNLST